MSSTANRRRRWACGAIALVGVAAALASSTPVGGSGARLPEPVALDEPAAVLEPAARLPDGATVQTMREAPLSGVSGLTLGLVARGEFTVDPDARVVVQPGRFSAVPEDPEDRYRFGTHPRGMGAFDPVPDEERCLRPELASAVQNLGLRFAEVFGDAGLHLVVGDGNSDGDHATHYGGAYVDLYTNLSNTATERFVERRGSGPDPHVARLPFVRSHLQQGGQLTYEESVALWLAMAIVDSRQFGRVVFEMDKVNELAESYAASQGVAFASGSIRHVGNRTHFFHMHLESEPVGWSRSCEM